MTTAPCYACGERPAAVMSEQAGARIRGESLIVCTVCHFGICWECVAIPSGRGDGPSYGKPSERNCCTRALAEGWDEKAVGVMASMLREERIRREVAA